MLLDLFSKQKVFLNEKAIQLETTKTFWCFQIFFPQDFSSQDICESQLFPTNSLNFCESACSVSEDFITSMTQRLPPHKTSSSRACYSPPSWELPLQQEHWVWLLPLAERQHPAASCGSQHKSHVSAEVCSLSSQMPEDNRRKTG